MEAKKNPPAPRLSRRQRRILGLLLAAVAELKGRIMLGEPGDERVLDGPDLDLLVHLVQDRLREMLDAVIELDKSYRAHRGKHLVARSNGHRGTL